MGPSLLSFYFKSVLLAFQAQQVVALRMLRLAAGRALAQRELQRMTLEKMMAAGKSGLGIAHDALRGYSARVRRNRRRLARR
jgi:hypothetical protein